MTTDKTRAENIIKAITIRQTENWDEPLEVGCIKQRERFMSLSEDEILELLTLVVNPVNGQKMWWSDVYFLTHEILDIVTEKYLENPTNP